MKSNIFHDWNEETPEAKARWFQSLSIEERMELLCEFTDLAFDLNPNIADTKNAADIARGARIIALRKE